MNHIDKIRLITLRTVALAAVVGCFCVGCDDASEVLEVEKERDVRVGAAEYTRYCALCHGKSGEGAAADHANALTNPNFLRMANDRFLRDSIERGRPGTPMSAWGEEYGGPLSSRDIDRIVSYLRAHQEGPNLVLPDVPITGNIDEAKPIYQEHCSDCHGEDGEGVIAPSINNPAFLALASDAFIMRSILDGRPGTPMESFREELSPAAVRNLTALIRSWDTGSHRPERAEFVDPWDSIPSGEAILNPGNPTPAFSTRDPWYVQADHVKRAMDREQSMLILDARPPSDWMRGHIPGSLPFPFYSEEPFENLVADKTVPIVIYCGCPHAAADRAAHRLQREGYQHLFVIDEGYGYWVEHDYPVERDPNAPEGEVDPHAGHDHSGHGHDHSGHGHGAH